MAEKQILGLKPQPRLEEVKSATNIPTACKIASIAQNDATILPHDASLYAG